MTYGYGNFDLFGKIIQNAYPHSLFPVFNAAELV
jgi:hypothetical protein